MGKVSTTFDAATALFELDTAAADGRISESAAANIRALAHRTALR